MLKWIIALLSGALVLWAIYPFYIAVSAIMSGDFDVKTVGVLFLYSIALLAFASVICLTALVWVRLQRRPPATQDASL